VTLARLEGFRVAMTASTDERLAFLRHHEITVLATVGWKHGMRTSTLRASECINRHLHVHTHVWRYEDCPEIRDYMERIAWLPDAESVTMYAFDEAPRLAEEYTSGRISSYFPVLRVNPL
jgi:hypothetical protein